MKLIQVIIKAASADFILCFQLQNVHMAVSTVEKTTATATTLTYLHTPNKFTVARY